ncbi:MAG: hypothetical protein ACQESG_06100 [Nanobdellota archaeon]
MKITTKLMEDTVAELVGEDVLPVMRYLKDKKDISEFQIADQLGFEVNQTRNMLYRMFDKNIVVYHRKKDRIKGWYISYWTLNSPRIKQLVRELKEQKLNQLKEKLTKEEANQNMFFLCPSLCVRVDFDQAINFEFKCPECGSLLSQQDNSKTIENLRKRIEELESELK